MAKINNITDKLIARMALVLGSDYKPLNYVIDIAKNKFTGNTKRYGVIPSPSTEASGETQSFTMDHSFTLKITDTYSNGATNQINDSAQAQKMRDLQDKALEIYNDVAVNKSIIGEGILIVNSLSMDEVEFLEDDKVAYLEFTINVKYRYGT